MRLIMALTLAFSITSVCAQTVIDTRIPSAAGGAQGIFVRVTLPILPRYGAAGAPVVVHVPGGFGSSALSVAPPPWSLPDCFEIRFNFPGGGSGATASGGTFDERGPNCMKALRDVVRFALGLGTDVSGRSLSDLVAPLLPMTANVGMVGWSNGGNATLVTAGLYGSDLPGLAWIVNWESPVGDGMTNAECGSRGKSPSVNPAYNPNDGTWDLSSLAYCDTLVVASEMPALRGGLYFDVNRSGAPERGTDFVPSPHFWAAPSGPTVFYSRRLIGESATRHLLPTPLPSHIASATETEAFWAYRNAEGWLSEVVRLLPNLLFLVVASDSDHVQTAPDHPHVLIQYEGMRTAGARFVRLNPDRCYVEATARRNLPVAADNQACIAFDHITIRSALEPDPDLLATRFTVAAAVYELADRTYTGNMAPQLDAVLTSLAPTPSLSPETPRLYQNYPNPFNNSTIICFSLQQRAHVELEVCDLLGRSIVRLIKTDMDPEEHKVVFVADGLPSGLYTYRLRAGSFVASKTMELLR